MSEEYGVVKVEGDRVTKALLSFNGRREFLKTVLKSAIDEMIEEYEPKALFFGMTKAKWAKAERGSRIWHLKDHVYSGWSHFKWHKELAKRLGVEVEEVEGYFYNTYVTTYDKLRELYNASEDGYLEIGVEYARFINKWSPPDES